MKDAIAEQAKIIEKQQARIETLEKKVITLSATQPKSQPHSLIRKYENAQKHFLTAIQNENLSKAEEWLAKRASVGDPDPDDLLFYPLLAAVYSLNFQIVQFIENLLTSEERAFQWSTLKQDRVITKLKKEKLTELKENSYPAIAHWHKENEGKKSMQIYKREYSYVERSSYKKLYDIGHHNLLETTMTKSPSQIHVHAVTLINDAIEGWITKIENGAEVKSNPPESILTPRAVPVVFSLSSLSASTPPTNTSSTINAADPTCQQENGIILS